MRTSGAATAVTRQMAMDSTPAAPRPPVADALYDARRGVDYTKPVLRGWLHLIWFGASLVFGTLLLAACTEPRGSRPSPSTRPA